MRLMSSIEVAERIFFDFGRLMRISLGSGCHVSQRKFETIEQNYKIFCSDLLFIHLFIYLFIYILFFTLLFIYLFFFFFKNVISQKEIKYLIRDSRFTDH